MKFVKMLLTTLKGVTIMNKTFLSKSNYCSAVQCEKILWLTKNKPKILKTKNNDSIMEVGREVGELAKGLFGDYEDVPSDDELNSRVNKTAELMRNKPNIITEASFFYNNNFCSVDILKNDSDGLEIYEVKSSTKLKDINLDDPSYQYFVLSNLGLNVKKVCVVYINNKYIRGKELDINQLFNVEDITDIAKEKQDEIRDNIDLINDFMQSHDAENEPVKELGNYCFKPYPCDFWDYCTRDLPKPNVFDIMGRMQIRTKLKKYNEGKISFEDLENENLNPKYLEQIDFELNVFDKEVKARLNKYKEVDEVSFMGYFTKNNNEHVRMIQKLKREGKWFTYN